MFGKKKRAASAYDPKKLEPAIRCSICTGEQTAGFRDRQTGQFRDVMLLRGEADLAAFREEYGVEGPIVKFY